MSVRNHVSRNWQVETGAGRLLCVLQASTGEQALKRASIAWAVLRLVGDEDLFVSPHHATTVSVPWLKEGFFLCLSQLAN